MSHQELAHLCSLAEQRRTDAERYAAEWDVRRVCCLAPLVLFTSSIVWPTSFAGFGTVWWIRCLAPLIRWFWSTLTGLVAWTHPFRLILGCRTRGGARTLLVMSGTLTAPPRGSFLCADALWSVMRRGLHGLLRRPTLPTTLVGQ